MPEPRPVAFRPGFRFAPTDALVLLAGAAAAWFAWRIEPWLGIAVLLPVALFFVYCNIVRMARPLELVWALAYAAGCVVRVQLGVPGWPWLVSGSVGLAAGLVVVQLRRPDYHGIGWQRINPQLPQWWATRRAPLG